MPKILSFKNYGIYIYSESGGVHHLPHCHVRWANGSVVVSIPTLKVLVGHKSLPKDVKAFLKENLNELLKAWNDLNP